MPATTPQKIISLSPTATEMLFAIGAGKQVIAVDDQSNFPERAPTTDLSGYTPNVEAIAGYDPDLVVLPDGQVKSQLEDLGIDDPRAARTPRSSPTPTRRSASSGRSPDTRRRRTALVSEMRADIADLSAEVPDDGKRPTAYYELDDTYFSADSSTFIGRLLQRGGFDNIADGAKAESPGLPAAVVRVHRRRRPGRRVPRRQQVLRAVGGDVREPARLRRPARPSPTATS